MPESVGRLDHSQAHLLHYFHEGFIFGGHTLTTPVTPLDRGNGDALEVQAITQPIECAICGGVDSLSSDSGERRE